MAMLSGIPTTDRNVTPLPWPGKNMEHRHTRHPAGVRRPGRAAFETEEPQHRGAAAESACPPRRPHPGADLEGVSPGRMDGRRARRRGDRVPSRRLVSRGGRGQELRIAADSVPALPRPCPVSARRRWPARHRRRTLSGRGRARVRNAVNHDVLVAQLESWNGWSQQDKKVIKPNPPWNLLADTADMHHKKWSDPPGSHLVTYARRSERRSPIPAPRALDLSTPMTRRFVESLFPGIIFLRETRRERRCCENRVSRDSRPKSFGNSVVMRKKRCVPLSRIGTTCERRISVRRPAQPVARGPRRPRQALAEQRATRYPAKGPEGGRLPRRLRRGPIEARRSGRPRRRASTPSTTPSSWPH